MTITEQDDTSEDNWTMRAPNNSESLLKKKNQATYFQSSDGKEKNAIEF